MKWFGFFLIFFSISFCFQVYDDGAVVTVLNNKQIQKKYEIRNFSATAEKVVVKPVLSVYPDKAQLPGRVELLQIPESELTFEVEPNSSYQLPIMLQPKRLVPGRYVYWLEFSLVKAQNQKLKDTADDVFLVPLLVDVQ